ncbi:MAG: type I polyketide synthase [Gemmatimonadota bacterium]|nr:type I polyketide synthase [Gemmatimonadota bacterium]
MDRFDSRFFRIAPIEARTMDPRQRMLMETSWQALEDAGMNPDLLRGSRTGVYAGISTSEYRDLMTGSAYGVSYLGTAASMAVGRLSFALGLEGPTIPVELNCASSLVAVHYAAAALWNEEVDMALVGGSHAILSPALTREMGDLGMLSPSGRCRAFDASADGFVRAEGCGMVVLKRLSEAEADGDRIWGVIRGSAVNQNGAAAGPTVPNGPAQERVIESALARGNVDPSEVDYLEAHGSGSGFGDPIEVQAAAAVYGREREADRPLLIGSVKTNIGHLEPAAGVASLIKTVLAMHRGVIPRNLHFHEPNPNLDWGSLPVRVVSANTDWPALADRPPRAGVSAFGISGTNAHVVVEGYLSGGDSRTDADPVLAGAPCSVDVSLPEPMAGLPLPENDVLQTRKTRFLPLSGKADGALIDLAGRYLDWLDAMAGTSASDEAVQDLLADMAWTAGTGRSHFDYRAGVVFSDAGSLRDGLKAVADAPVSPEPVDAGKVAFAFGESGIKRTGMARTLYETEPVARAVLDRCEEAFGEIRGDSLLSAMFERAGTDGLLEDPALARTAVYALQCALTALWSSAGIRPNAVTGRGPGELAAAQAAGVLSLEEGLRLASAQGADELVGDVACASPSLDFVSGITGRVIASDEALDAEYWRRQQDETASFRKSFDTLAELGISVIIAIGMDAVQYSDVRRAWPVAANGGGAPVVIDSLRIPGGENSEADDGGIVKAVADAYESGLAVRFEGLFAGEERRRIALPPYPFQRRRHWI